MSYIWTTEYHNQLADLGPEDALGPDGRPGRYGVSATPSLNSWHSREYQSASKASSNRPTRRRSRVFAIVAAVSIVLLISAVAIATWLALAGNDDVLSDAERLKSYRTEMETNVHEWKLDLYRAKTGSSQVSAMPSDIMTSRIERGFLMQAMVKKLSSMQNKSIDELLASAEANSIFRSTVSDLCDVPVTCSEDVMASPYRTYDGSCNNVQNPTWGMTWQPQRRILRSEYDDGLGVPRMRSVSSGRGPLPSPRAVSNVVHATGTDRRADMHTTVMVMAFGQFLSHDTSFTPEVKVPNAAGMDCCKRGHKSPSSGHFESCLTIDVPADDTYFRPSSCMEFVRTAPATCRDCKICRREQLNGMTSYIDASQVYGATTDVASSLRSFEHGRMKVTGNDDMLPAASNDTCRLTVQTQHCFAAGDNRANVVPNLSSHHTAFVRYHNLIAKKLADENPHWFDEKLYQEARKIVVAVMQNIVYSEYLPVFLDNVTMETYGLRVQVEGHVDVYDSNVDATVSNAFSTAAFRFGHTTIPNNQVSLSESYQHLATVDIAKTFHNPNMTYHHCDGVARWLVNDTGIASDGLFVDGVRNLLFRDAQNISTDLPARNIQRGRDHGLPAYNQWRRYCYFTVISQEEFARKGTPMGNFSTETSDKFRQIYEHADDIDLFSGAMKEIPLPGAQVGPVFACLLGNEFRRLKIGDRFYFENPSPQSGPETGFTPEQLTSLRAIRLSKIMCLTMNAPTIQKYVFHPTSETNLRVTCESLPEIDFSKWRTSA